MLNSWNTFGRHFFQNWRGDDWFENETGASAIEFALVVPFLLFLYFGLIDVTGLISMNRRIVSASATMADLVSQQRNSILASQVTDDYNAAYVILQPVASGNVRVELYDYRTVSGTITKIWSTNNGKGVSCGTAPSTSTMTNLMTAGNDVIVARSCTYYYPAVASFLGVNIVGATSFLINQTISVRPRASLQLNCYATTVAAGTLCS